MKNFELFNKFVAAVNTMTLEDFANEIAELETSLGEEEIYDVFWANGLDEEEGSVKEVILNKANLETAKHIYLMLLKADELGALAIHQP